MKSNDPGMGWSVTCPVPFTMVWASGELSGIDHAAFDKSFDTMSNVWFEILRYLKHHPDRTTQNKVADIVRSKIGYDHIVVFEFRRLYHLAWSYFNNQPQRLVCNPGKYRRLVGCFCFNPSKRDIQLTHMNVHMSGRWEIPDDYWGFNIIPNNYAAIEQLKDAKGNLTYMLYVNCLEYDSPDVKSLVVSMFNHAKHASNIRTKQDMVAFITTDKGIRLL